MPGVLPFPLRYPLIVRMLAVNGLDVELVVDQAHCLRQQQQQRQQQQSLFSLPRRIGAVADEESIGLLAKSDNKN